MHEERDLDAIERCLANLPQIVNFATEIYFPNRERVVDAEVTDDKGEVVQRTYVLPPWAHAPHEGKCSWCGDQKDYPNYNDISRPIKCLHCVGIVQIAAEIAIPLTDAATSVEAEVEVLEAARKHILECKQDFETRRNVASIFGQSCGSKDISLNETFGFDHQALEGYPSYEQSLRAVLTDEINSLKKKNSLVPDVPLSP